MSVAARLSAVVLNGDPNGAIDVNWSVPSEYPVDYRINWAAEGEGLSELDRFERKRLPGRERLHDRGIGLWDVCYKVRAYGRGMGGSAGGWIEAQGKINGSC